MTITTEKLFQGNYTMSLFKDSNSINNPLRDYEALRNFIDKLNSQQYHFVNSNDICTPMGCVEEMVDSIPSTFFKKRNIKILDPCAGNGNFFAYLTQKTNLQNLYFNEINPTRVRNIRKIFGNQAQITEIDFLDFEDREEYDLVVANPPYAKFTDGKRTAKNHNVSREFILKAINVTKPGGYILFIVPDNWMSYADSNHLPRILSQYQFLHLNIHGAKKWFPQVGSSFSWFLLQKTPNAEKFTVENNYKIPSLENVSLDKGVNYIPLYYSERVRTIINKTLNAPGPKYKIETSSDLHKYTKKHLLSTENKGEYAYKVHHTPKQVVWSVRPHKYQDGWKVYISLTNQYGTFIDCNTGMTQSIAFIRCKNQRQAEQIQTELNCDTYIFLNNITRYGNFNNIRVLQQLPVLGSFRLNAQEVEFIKKFNSAYAPKKKTIAEYTL